MDYLQYFYDMCRVYWKLKSVLNLIINGLPSIHSIYTRVINFVDVLNLIINGLPSIHRRNKMRNVNILNEF